VTDIDIKVDDQAVRKALGEAQKQFPFTLSLAVNNVTKDAQGQIREGIKSRFTLRRPDFILREGAKISKFGTKTNPNAVIRITEKAGFLVKFEEGDEKRPIDGKAIAVPLAVKRNKRDLIPAAQRPPALYASKGGQAGRIFSAGGKLWQAVGRGRNAVVRALYAWKSSVRVRPMLRFRKTTQDAVDKNWDRRALEAVDKALSTMR
jgi:hypothetical protein